MLPLLTYHGDKSAAQGIEQLYFSNTELFLLFSSSSTRYFSQTKTHKKPRVTRVKRGLRFSKKEKKSEFPFRKIERKLSCPSNTSRLIVFFWNSEEADENVWRLQE